MMSRRRAPSALRMPISRVRSVTETSMMFMIPMPPTSRLMPPIAPRSSVMICDTPWTVWRTSCWRDDGEVVRGALLDPVPVSAGAR